ncbi:hypothetical protein EW146_g1459 [Bondarzewia mesenterica]|uniref:Uncharacterized protein n=1 Tax=Bondarzewia mesenterica TaxID=1095465 RepID=A0A4V3XG29_9AGAM|nr:hypothetical protein EW146_g1459 [Bondarzewia mesenterica]
MSKAAFSRLQLAAALIEYDNDPANPNAPFRSAHDSAIFAHMRRAPRPPQASRKSADYLGVNLPSELGGRESAMSHGRARSSIDALRNPFATDGPASDDLEEEEKELEVDLASWGLDSFMPKEKTGKKDKKKDKERLRDLPNPYSDFHQSGPRTSRAVSLSAADSFGLGGAFLDSPPTPGPVERRRSLGSALELAGELTPTRPAMSKRPSSAHLLIESIPTTAPLHAVPFPTTSVRSPSPTNDAGSPFDPNSEAHKRRQSTASFGSRGLLNDEQEENSFAFRPPSPGQTSRFDPKAARERKMSVGTVGSMGSRNMLAEDNPFALDPPSRPSRFDPKAAAHARTTSNISFGSRMLPDNDAVSVMSGQPLQYSKNRPYSTLELMRPKVLVMPSPLQGIMTGPEPPKLREGFELSTDGTPLPPGARTSRRASQTLLTDIRPPASAVPIASNSFTPNPRADLSLSQLTFRNSLMVGGQRDVAYSDFDARLKRATEEGEQIVDEIPQEEEEEPVRPVTVVVDEPVAHGRPVGKLYGKSLIDDIEMRKAKMRGKQRVFTGDDRPSMMARGQIRRQSTLIDPASLQRTVSTNLAPLSPNDPQPLGRRHSIGPKPLLSFDDNTTPAGAHLSAAPGVSHSRSVFGVDTLWEREMAKLKEIEAQEEEDRKRTEAAELDKKSNNKGKKKKKGKGKEKAEPQDESPTPPTDAAEPRVSAEPPVLPDIPKGITRGPPPPPNDDDTESESEDSDAAGPVQKAHADAEHWYASDDENENGGPVRTVGVGPRYPNRARGRPSAAQGAGSDSEEDLPLVATIDRAMQRATRLVSASAAADDSDEEKPLSTLLEKTKLNMDFDAILSPSGSGARKGKEPAAAVDDDEDDQPLGLRASRFSSMLPPSSGGDEDEDDMPLGLRPEQQRRTQYHMMLQQQQQQQQQMMMQQMHTGMMFSNPSLMGSGFFGPPMMQPVMMPMVAPMVPTSATNA